MLDYIGSPENSTDLLETHKLYGVYRNISGCMLGVNPGGLGW